MKPSSNRKSRRSPDRLQQVKRKRLIAQAPSWRWSVDVQLGQTPYPTELMQLSRAKTLVADPSTMDNFNPVGERGEHLYTPKQNVNEEDMIDFMPPNKVGERTEHWPSSAGVVVNAGELLRSAAKMTK